MNMPVLLIVDDEKPTRDALRMGFQDDYEVYTASNLAQAVTLMREESPDLVLTDLRLGGESGMDVLKSAAALPHPPQSIMMTAYGSVDAAVEAMKQGAYDFVTKPLNLDAVEMVLKRALHTRNLETANQELTSRPSSRRHYPPRLPGKPPGILSRTMGTTHRMGLSRTGF